MNQVDRPKKPLIYYYAIVLLAIALLNLFAIPALNQRQIQEVDYGTFMKATENQEIKEVQIENNQILYTLRSDEKQIYKTGLMNDPGLTERLYESGQSFPPRFRNRHPLW